MIVLYWCKISWIDSLHCGYITESCSLEKHSVNHHVVRFKYLTVLFVDYTSKKPKTLK